MFTYQSLSLAQLLAHADVDIRLAAIGAISLINDRRSQDILIQYLFAETDEYAVDFLHEVLSEMDGQGPPLR